MPVIHKMLAQIRIGCTAFEGHWRSEFDDSDIYDDWTIPHLIVHHNCFDQSEGKTVKEEQTWAGRITMVHSARRMW